MKEVTPCKHRYPHLLWMGSTSRASRSANRGVGVSHERGGRPRCQALGLILLVKRQAQDALRQQRHKRPGIPQHRSANTAVAKGLHHVVQHLACDDDYGRQTNGNDRCDLEDEGLYEQQSRTTFSFRRNLLLRRLRLPLGCRVRLFCSRVCVQLGRRSLVLSGGLRGILGNLLLLMRLRLRGIRLGLHRSGLRLAFRGNSSLRAGLCFRRLSFQGEACCKRSFAGFLRVQADGNRNPHAVCDEINAGYERQGSGGKLVGVCLGLRRCSILCCLHCPCPCSLGLGFLFGRGLGRRLCCCSVLQGCIMCRGCLCLPRRRIRRRRRRLFHVSRRRCMVLRGLGFVLHCALSIAVRSRLGSCSGSKR
mmetsp:Transcript_86048/g.240572  ORF Transcript_86048/g.240572 Transcript_86048/m.240572 type:complete len:363 (+) Transcript_86048:1427-2515(+)